MTPAELHKLLLDTVVGAHKELATVGEFADPAVLRAIELLTSAINRVLHVANEAHADEADVADVVANIHRGRIEACACPCHSDGHGHREWPLLTDSVARITACANCREDHDRVTIRRDSAA
jgi:hypothetical protein